MMQYTSSEEEDDDDIGFKSLNISNDQYYRNKIKLKIKRQQQEDDFQLKLSKISNTFPMPNYGSPTIKHSIPAYDLWKAFFPTYLNHDKFLRFHRPQLRHYNTGPQAKYVYKHRAFSIKNLTRHIFKCHKELQSKVIRALQNGVVKSEIENNIFRIKHAKDLTAKNGELFLFEYSEQQPPVLGQIGMASNVKNYIAPLGLSTTGVRSPFVNKKNKNNNNNETDIGLNTSQTSNVSTNNSVSDINQNEPKTSLTSKSSKSRLIGYPEEQAREPPALYFCPMRAGSRAQMIENNLYRAPIFEHEMSDCDFLVIRTRNSLYVRSINKTFTVGQTMPLAQIPPPNESQITRFRCDISNLYIHKLYGASNTDPPSLNMQDLVKLFPDYHPQALLKRTLLRKAECCRIGNERIFYQGANHGGTIPWSGRCKIITPEQYCLFMSSLAARERLRELNYTESMINPSADVIELEPEILAAPWNTSKAVMNMMKGQCFLDLRKHLIDPTGQSREGFSCISWVRSPTEEQQNKEALARKKFKNITSSDGGDGGGDQAQPPIVFGKNPMLHKIKAEKLERLAIYRREAQLIVETQAKVLSCQEAITSSEGENDEDDGDENVSENETALTQQMKDLEKLVNDGQSISAINHEKEEEVRRQMLEDIRSGNQIGVVRKPAQLNGLKDTNGLDLASLKGKILLITRIYENDGTYTKRSEVVREPKVIALYMRHKDFIVPRKPDLEITPERRESMDSGVASQVEGTKLRIWKKHIGDTRPMRGCRQSI